MSDPVTPSTEELQGSLQAPLSMRILQAKILEWVTISSSMGSSQTRVQIHVSSVFFIGSWVLY